MKVGLNLLFLVPGEVGGSEPLLTNLAGAIAESGEAELLIYALKGFASAYPDLSAKAEIAEPPWGSGTPARRIIAENTWLAIDAKKRNLDAMHHGVGTTPWFKTLPTVVTIHDVQYRHYPQNFSRTKRAWLNLNVPYSLRTCRVITTPSEWVRADLVDKFGLDPSRVVVVPFGSKGLFGSEHVTMEQVRDQHGLIRPFFFFPGRTYPHKNHLFLLEAFAPLANRFDLVFSGPTWGRDNEVMNFARDLSIGSSVKHLGLVPRGELAGIYEAAVALVYPTLFEGFGAPILEAMSRGCPVLASNTTAIPEVVGDAGILLEPNAKSTWTDSMKTISEDSSMRNQLVAKGYERAAEFSWESAAIAQLKAYRMATE